MEINKTIETPNGSVTFTGTLNQQELDVVLSVGLNVLLASGVLAKNFEERKEKEDPQLTLELETESKPVTH